MTESFYEKIRNKLSTIEVMLNSLRGPIGVEILVKTAMNSMEDIKAMLDAKERQDEGR